MTSATPVRRTSRIARARSASNAPPIRVPRMPASATAAIARSTYTAVIGESRVLPNRTSAWPVPIGTVTCVSPSSAVTFDFESSVRICTR